MAGRLSAPGRPADYAGKKGFPTVRRGAPEAVRRCAEVVMNLLVLTDEHGVRETARLAGISHSTLSRTLSGDVWPSFVTIVAIEEAFDTDVWA